MATVGDDVLVTLSTMDVVEVVRRICAATGTLLTSQRWHQYIPESAYAPPCG